MLGLPELGPRDGFFALGGHSLLALRLLGRIRTALGVELTLRDVFQEPTPAGLARRAVAAGTAARPARRPAPRKTPGEAPLSSAQRRLWFLHRLEGPSAAYNIPLAVRLTGTRLDVDALRAALADLVARHEILRTVYPDTDGLPCQRLLEPATPDLRVVDHVSEAELADRLRQLAGEGFRLDEDAPFRAHLLLLGPEEHVLLLVLHHIAADGWSLDPLLLDLAAACRARMEGREPGWAPLPLQYADYCAWQHDLLGDASASDQDRQLAHWREALAGLPDELPSPPTARAPPAPRTMAATSPSAWTRTCTGGCARWPPRPARRCSWSCRRGSPPCSRAWVPGPTFPRHARRGPRRRAAGRPGRLLRQHPRAAHRHLGRPQFP